MHDWPLLRNFASIAPSTARSRSQSAKTMKGASPPSSMRGVTTRCAASFRMERPTEVDPVKLTTRNDRTTRGKRRREFPSLDRNGEIPGAQAQSHACGSGQRVVASLAHFGGHDLANRAASLLGKPPEVLR